jgi:hypothetical protein
MNVPQEPSILAQLQKFVAGRYEATESILDIICVEIF